ncbi:MAG: hypothetical protein IJV00_01365 [Clostridia bacterium]|nr:hypothetical protein [Clostridia bacterium]
MKEVKKMKGVFRTPKIRYAYSLILIAAGSFIALRFGLWGIEAVRSGGTNDLILCFFFAALGLLTGFSSIFLFNFNKGASLEIDGEKIDAVFGFGTELHEPLSSLRRAQLDRGAKSLTLFFGDKAYWITGLENAKELIDHIALTGGCRRTAPPVEEAEADFKKRRGKFILYLALLAVFVLLLFVHIAWCVILTNGNDPVSSNETPIFAAFAVAELITLIGAFVFADKCAKQNLILQISRSELLTAVSSAHENDSLEKYPGLIEVKFFDGFSYRIVIFAPDEEKRAYMLEKFDLKSRAWIKCYDAAPEFDGLSELNRDIEERFENVIFDD